MMSYNFISLLMEVPENEKNYLNKKAPIKHLVTLSKLNMRVNS